MARVSAQFLISVNRNIFAEGLDCPIGLNRLTKSVFRRMGIWRLKQRSSDASRAKT